MVFLPVKLGGGSTPRPIRLENANEPEDQKDLNVEKEGFAGDVSITSVIIADE
jgi:hypothetical protein